MRRPTLLLGLVVALLLGAMAAKSQLIRIPPVRAQSAADQFDANRAAARLAHLLGDERPHPTDTPANDAVRARLVGLLTDMGLRPAVRDQIACNEYYKSRGVGCARVRNVVAVLGPSTGKALLLNAHYDSNVTGPGAGDAGAGVATLLEVASILRGRPLPRPIILLFNEGEELGLIGARAFLADPLSRGVDSLINLEARGVRGPVNMFETSRPSGPAIGVFSRAAARPVANSLSTDVYRLMPNYTDVNSFSERGWLTLNLAPIGNETRYHSAGDNLAALDRATLQHMGDQTLALTRELASGTPDGRGDRIFMDVAGRVFVTLPLLVGAVLLALVLLGLGIVAVRRGGLGRSAGIVIGTVVLSTALSWVILALVGLVRHGQFWRAYPSWTHLATYATVLLVTTLLLATIGRRSDVVRLRAAFWLIYALLGAAIGFIAPGGIIFFIFPPLFVLLGMIASRWWKSAELVGAIAALLALYLTWGAMLGLLEELLSGGPLWVFAPLGALIIVPLLIEAKALVDAAGRRGAALTAAAFTIIGWTVAGAVPAYSADRQQRFVIEHVTDADKARAYWSVLSGGEPVPEAYEAEGEWRWAKLPYAEAKRWLADAPRARGTAAPTVERVSSLRRGNERTITVRLRPNGAQRIALIGPEDAQIRAAGIGGFVRPIDAAAESGNYVISCFGRSCEGLELAIVTGRTGPVIFTIVGISPGLPPSAAPLIAERPRFARPQYVPDQTIVFRRTKL